MKKYVLIVFLTAFVLAVTVFATALLANDANARTVEIFKVEGSDVKMTKGTAKKYAAKSGYKMYDGYTALTGAESSLSFKLDEDSIAKMDQKSEVKVNKTSNKNLSITLLSGEMSVDAAAQADDNTLEVRAGNSALVIRGTLVLFEFINNKYTIIMLRGEALVDGVPIKAGEIMDVYGTQTDLDHVIRRFAVSDELTLFQLETLLDYFDELVADGLLKPGDMQIIINLINEKKLLPAEPRPDFESGRQYIRDSGDPDTSGLSNPVIPTIPPVTPFDVSANDLLNNYTVSTYSALIENATIGNPTGAGATLTVNAGNNFVIPAGLSLTIPDAPVSPQSALFITTGGQVTVNGTLNTAENSGINIVNGGITVTSSTSMHHAGEMIVDVFGVLELTNSGLFELQETGYVECNGTLKLISGSITTTASTGWDYFEINAGAIIEFGPNFNVTDPTFIDYLNSCVFPDYQDASEYTISKTNYKGKTFKLGYIGSDEVVWMDITADKNTGFDITILPYDGPQQAGCGTVAPLAKITNTRYFTLEDVQKFVTPSPGFVCDAFSLSYDYEGNTIINTDYAYTEFYPTGDTTIYVRFNGDGSEGKPVLIYTDDDFSRIQGDYSSKHFMLMNHINIRAPLGTGGFGETDISKETPSYRFNGSFDGNGHTVTVNSNVYNYHFTVTCPEDEIETLCTGFIPWLGTGTVKNLVIECSKLIDADIVGGTGGYGVCYVGGIVGKMDNGTIENCAFLGIIIQGVENTADNTEADQHIGGIVGGMTGGIVKNCVAFAQSVVCGTNGGDAYIGRVAGSVSGGGTIVNCYARDAMELLVNNFVIGMSTGLDAKDGEDITYDDLHKPNFWVTTCNFNSECAEKTTQKVYYMNLLFP